MTSDKMILLFFYQLRLRISAQRGGFGASITKTTAAWEMQRTWHNPRNGVQTLFLFVSCAGPCVEQTHCVRMKGSREDRLGAGAFTEFARVPDCDRVGLLSHDSEIMRNQQKSHADFL